MCYLLILLDYILHLVYLLGSNIMNHSSVLITGNSTGLGHAFTEFYLDKGATVYGFSRSGCNIAHPNLHDAKIDLAQIISVQAALKQLLTGVDKLDLVILNAGILGAIEPMHGIQMDSLQTLMDINVWANKNLLDYLCESDIQLAQVVAISSGAAVNGNKGWGAYSLSKATLNMLMKLYAAEYQSIHFTALAPGLIDTRMQDHLCDQSKVDEGNYPSVGKLRGARGTDAMPVPGVAARNIAAVLPGLKGELASGEFVDMRDL